MIREGVYGWVAVAQESGVGAAAVQVCRGVFGLECADAANHTNVQGRLPTPTQFSPKATRTGVTRPAYTARRATLVPRLRVLLSVNKCDSLGIRIFDVFRFGELFRELVKRNL